MNKLLDRRRGTVRHVFIYSAQCGFNLIELMVASTIGLLIMTAVLTLFLNVSRTNDEMAKTNMLIENGRFAIQLLQNDIAHAGFWDTYIPDFDDLTLTTASPAEIPTGVHSPCLDYSSLTSAIRTNLLGVSVQVHDSLPPGCDSVITNRKSNTDILVVRHVETCIAGAAGCEVTVDGKLYFQASRCEDDPFSYVLDTSGHGLLKRGCKTDDFAPKRRFISHIYYIRDYSVTMGDGIPALMRSEVDLDSGKVKAKSAVALIEGIEEFRVELGVDRISDNGTDIIDTDSYKDPVNWENNDVLNRGDGVPDEFVHCESNPDSESYCSVDRLINVVAVKLHLLVRSLTSTAGYVDGKTYALGEQTITPAANDNSFKRHVFSTVVRLNNVSGRRETP
ncbi:PilW family protein [Azotobacter chroococcum]|uniref:Type 4 pilus assembly transmembrane protein n=1 Tax=Azotobacter chroococcum NCIMB 8003 TaxID=1328314 RepID=A0A0C4WGX8_9GAMM|nr:PilW family protein [Azotobacter chroococcum]AJE20458.1 Type 4 pilus assembly transmembrane protein [Azotobacter chroococcum NCIMB 8003]